MSTTHRTASLGAAVSCGFPAVRTLAGSPELEGHPQRHELLCEVVRIAAEEDGAWVALRVLVDRLGRTGTQADSSESTTTRAPEAEHGPADADRTARRLAARCLAGLTQLPADAAQLRAAAGDLDALDDTRVVQAMWWAERLRQIADAVARVAMGTLPAGAAKGHLWPDIVSGEPGASRRTELASELLGVALDAHEDSKRRSNAFLLASMLALLEREVGDAGRAAAVWRRLDATTTEGRLGLLASATARKTLAASGIRARIADHFSNAVAGGAQDLAEGVFAVVLEKALVAAGCQPASAAEMDPVARLLRRTITALFGHLDDVASAAALEGLCALVGLYAEAPETPVEGGLTRVALARIISPLAGAPAGTAHDHAMACLAVLAYWDLRARVSGAILPSIGAKGDLDGRTSYSVLGRALGQDPPRTPAEAIGRKVLEQGFGTEQEFVQAVNCALTPSEGAAPAPGARTAAAAPESAEASGRAGARARGPTKTEWQLWALTKLAGKTQSDAGAILGTKEGNEPVPQWKVSRSVRVVREYLDSGGALPQEYQSHNSPLLARVRPIDPHRLDEGSPKLNARPRNDDGHASSA